MNKKLASLKALISKRRTSFSEDSTSAEVLSSLESNMHKESVVTEAPSINMEDNVGIKENIVLEGTMNISDTSAEETVNGTALESLVTSDEPVAEVQVISSAEPVETRQKSKRKKK